jgi:MFS superfamily sulfate permease-like transporter
MEYTNLFAFPQVRVKLSGREYLTVLATFVAINLIGLNPGLIFGVCLSVLDFVVTYASRSAREGSNTVTKIERQSLALRHPSQMRCLKANQGAILSFQLHGTAFFGSSVDILNTISGHILGEPGSITRNQSSSVSLALSSGKSSPAFDGLEDSAKELPSETSKLLAADVGAARLSYGKDLNPGTLLYYYYWTAYLRHWLHVIFIHVVITLCHQEAAHQEVKKRTSR